MSKAKHSKPFIVDDPLGRATQAELAKLRERYPVKPEGYKPILIISRLHTDDTRKK